MKLVTTLAMPKAATSSRAPDPAPGHTAAGGGPRLSVKERFLLLEQLATLLDSGIQIPAALQSMRQQCAQPRVAAALAALEQGVLGGLPLSACLAAQPRSFPSLVVQLVRAGEATGALGDMLRRTVDAMETEAQLRGKLRSALIYPLAMLGLTAVVVGFLLAFVVPRFERMFRGRTLPGPTRILIGLGDVVSHHGVWLLAAAAGAVIGLVLFLRTPRGVRGLDRLLLAVPGAAPLYRTAVLARCVRTLGLLLQSGVPVHAALEHARAVAGSPAYAALWQATRDHVMNGGSMAEALRGQPLVGSTLQQVVAAGESTACLDQAMLKTAAQYTRELERRIRDLLTLVEPAMVVLLGGVVGFIALSIMLPIFQMSRT